MPGLIAAVLANLLLGLALAGYLRSASPIPSPHGAAPFPALVVIAWMVPAAYVAWVGVRSDQRGVAHRSAGQGLAAILVGLAALAAALILANLRLLLARDEGGYTRELGFLPIEMVLLPYLGFVGWSLGLGVCVLTAPAPSVPPAAPAGLLRDSWWLPLAALLGGVLGALRLSGYSQAMGLAQVAISAVVGGIGLYLVTRPPGNREWSSLTGDVDGDFDAGQSLWLPTPRQWGTIVACGGYIGWTSRLHLSHGLSYLVGLSAAYLVIAAEKALVRRRMRRR